MTIPTQLYEIRRRVAAAAARSGRPAEAVRLIAISKQQDVAAILAAYDAGQRDFGESYAQELVGKAAQCPGNAIEWHLVGHLQRNKLNALLPIVTWIHSLDSLPLAEAIAQRARHPLRCLLQVNLAGEPRKQGCRPEAAAGLIAAMAGLPQLEIHGLMAIPPPATDPTRNRPYFRALAQLLTTLDTQHLSPRPLRELSMGMSDDFEAAIEEGATMVRIGTAIFGARHGS